MNPDPSLADVMEAAIDARLMDVHTTTIGRVERVHTATRKVDVRAVFKRVLQTDEGELVSESLPLIQQIPLGAFRAGGARIELPVAVGTWVVLVFFSDNIGKWIAQGGVDIESGDVERHGLTGAVAIPLLYPDTDQPAAPLSQTEIVVAMGATVMRVSAAGVHVTGNLTVTGDVTAGAAAPLTTRTLLTHVHLTGMGPSDPPSTPP
jgi:hypothetical protein